MYAVDANVMVLSLHFPRFLTYGLIDESGTAVIAEIVQGMEHCTGWGDPNCNHKTAAPKGRERLFKPQKVLL